MILIFYLAFQAMKDKLFRYFVTKKVKYIWDKNLRQFQKLRFVDKSTFNRY